MDPTRRALILGGLALAASPRSVLAQTTAIGGPAFGSTWRLVGVQLRPDASSLVTRRIAQIDALMSPYRAESVLSRFNQAGVGEAIELPDMLYRVVEAALSAARDTDGAFDPTLGPLTHRFGFGPITGQSGGLGAITLHNSTLHKATAGATLDLCGIAKGYALDRLVGDLTQAGATDCLVELGGEVRALGNHPSGRPWQVAIENPSSPTFEASHIVAPGTLALATSGHRANGMRGPVALSHVIDPRSARPATDFAGSVSVLAETAMEADAMATALLAMGDDGPMFAQRTGTSALFIPFAGTASITTGQFADHLVA